MDEIVRCIMWVSCLIAALGGTVLTHDPQCLFVMCIPAFVILAEELWL